MAAMQSGFADPVGEAQAVFRAILAALSRPGRIRELPGRLTPPKPLTPELAALALALADPDAPLWLDGALAREPAIAEYLRFQSGAPIVSKPSGAAFALVRRPEDLPATELFALGSQDYPDRSTTIVLAVDSLSEGEEFAVAGPGVKGEARFSAGPLPADFAERVQANHALFPRGVDWLLAGPGRVLGLPRSSRLSRVSVREAA